MKAFRRISILILLLTIATPAMAQFKKGSGLVPLWQSQKKIDSGSSRTMEDYVNGFEFMGYIKGVFDALDESDRELHQARPSNPTIAQACAIVGKYLDEHPEEWHLSGAVIVQKALRAAFIKK